MSAGSSFLDVQTLAQLTCERSKQWASFMENYSQDAEEGLELDMDELEEVFDELNYEKLAEEENDDVDDEEEAIECEEDSEDDDAVMDITNCTIIKCENMDKNEQQQNQFALVDKHGNIEKNKKFQDFLNQTLNIFSEHQRQLRESGVDRMLQTFDAQKIEATLGGYLERHNKTLDLSYFIPYKLFTKSHHSKHHHCSKQPLVSFAKSKCNESDSESMHSIDTAQYIRSSRRQQRISQKNPASATTTMTIKTFRMVKSKRDALKQKYACAEYDEDHLEEVKMRRRQRKFEEVHSYRECHDNSAAAYYHQQKKQQRRKQLRKRRSTCSQSYSSSDMSSDTSSDYDSHAMDSPYCSHTHITGSSVKRRMSSHKPKCHGRHCACGMQATPLQAHHIIQNYKMLPESHRKRKQHNISTGELMDARPCRRESECPCKNQRTLCRSYRHVANSSSEDWFVENCLTPKSNKINSAKLELLTAIRAQPMNDFHKSLKPRKINVNKQEEPSFKLSESSDDDDDGRNQPKSSRKKENCRKRKVKKEVMETIEISDDNPDYRKSVKRNARKKVSLKDNNNKSLEKSNDLDDSLFKAELEKAIIESKALYEQQNKKTLNDNNNETMTPKNDIHRTKKRLDQLARTLKPQPKTAKLRKLLELSGNSSFLANTNNIYNSTAVANNSTMNDGKRIGNALKNSAFSLSNCEEENTSAHKTKDSDNDCTIVTSTTDAINSSSNYHANKGILIYKPNTESGGDGASCSSQSYFNVTQEHLAAVIGAKSASKFLKYYVGRRRFNSSSTIYYRPPEPQLNAPVSSSASSSQLAKADSNGQSPDSSVSEEDDDILERVNQYGELYESVRKSN